MARQGQSPAQAGSLGWPAEGLSADHSRGTFGRRVRSHPEQTQAEDRVDKERDPTVRQDAPVTQPGGWGLGSAYWSERTAHKQGTDKNTESQLASCRHLARPPTSVWGVYFLSGTMRRQLRIAFGKLYSHWQLPIAHSGPDPAGQPADRRPGTSICRSTSDIGPEPEAEARAEAGAPAFRSRRGGRG